MEWNKLIIPIVGITVSIICLATILMPVINDATATSDTFTNEGYFYVDSVTSDESITYLFENGALKINGETVPLPTGSQYPDGLTIIYTEHICIRYDEGYMKVRGVANHNCFYLNVTATEGRITGTYQWTDGEPQPVNWTYTEFVGMANETTNRIMCKSQPQYMKSDSYIETTGLVRLPNITGYYVVHISGTIADGITVNFYNQGSGAAIDTITASSIQTNTTAVAGYENLYKLNSITFTASDGTNSDNVTFTIYTIPAAVTADRSMPLSNSEIGVLLAIPVMVILVILMAAASMIMRNRE